MNVIAFRALLVGPLLFTASLTDAQEPLAFNQLHVGLSGGYHIPNFPDGCKAVPAAEPNGPKPMPSREPARKLRALLGNDHFAAQADGQYAVVADPLQRAQLNRQVDSAAAALAAAWDAGATSGQLLELLTKHLFAIDRDTLDTEDAEHVAGVFARMLDILGIESSGGALNTWMYGFDPA